MTGYLTYILLIVPLFLGGLYFNFFAQTHDDESSILQEKLGVLTKQNIILKDISQIHGLESLKTMGAHHQSFKKNPKEHLKKWAHKYHLSIDEINSPSPDTFECAFKAPLDTDVYSFIKDLEKNYFKLLSLGLYRDKVLNTIQGRLIIAPFKQEK